MTLKRCSWPSNDLAIAYHDTEWGVPEHDDRKLYELLTLEGAQAGLSWDTILKKRERYRAVFAGFDPSAVARFTAARQESLLRDPGIVRNRLKVQSAVSNARAVLQVQHRYGSFDAFVWEAVGGVPLRNRRKRGDPIPASSAQSDALSARLRSAAFRFAGSTICYAFMQAAGMVNDHLVDCFRYGCCG